MSDGTNELSALYNLKHDLIIDEEAFDKAINELQELVSDIFVLGNEVEDMLDTLQEGFNTPAGRKFMNACRYYVSAPIQMQKIVISHICSSLTAAKNGYVSVFEEYRQLRNSIAE